MKKKLPKKSAHISGLLQHFKQELLALYPEKLVGIILFGSYARGNFGAESDIDLLLLFDDSFCELRKDDPIFDLMLDYMIEQKVVIMPTATKKSLFDTRKTPLYMNIKKEGIFLWKK